MKPEKAVILTVLACASLVLSYWLGYESGWRAKSHASIAATPTAVVVKTEVPEKAKDAGGKNQPKQTQAQAPLANIAKGPFTYAPRDPGAKPIHIDLTAWYNASLSGTWHSEMSGNDLGSLPSGLQSFDGTMFDVRGLIQTKGPFIGRELYPTNIDGIRIDLRCEKLHFLHNSCGSGKFPPQGGKIGEYVIHYADGEKLSVPIRYGENIANWWGTADKMPRPTEAVVVWEGENQASSKMKPPRRVLITKYTWQNPKPDVEIASLDIVGDDRQVAPFLIAITAEQ